MAKPLGLTRRGSSQQVRITVPQDLREAYGGRVDFRIAVKSSGNEAKTEATRLRAQKDAEFSERRRMLAAVIAQVTAVTPELGNAIALGVYARAMAQDDMLRDDPEMHEAMSEVASLAHAGSDLGIPSDRTATPPADGMSDAAANTLAALNALLDADSAISLARRRLAVVQPLADDVARRMGLSIDWTTDTARDALRECLVQYRK